MTEELRSISAEDAVNYVFGRIGANFEYEAFLKLFEKPNNREIENTLVMKALREILTKNESPFRIMLESKTHLFRGRKLDGAKTSDPNTSWSVTYKDEKMAFIGLDEYDSKEPPIGKSPSQRNNYKGASYLYLSEDKYTACAEVRPEISSLISLADFEVLRPLSIIDLANEQRIQLELSSGNKLIHFPTLISSIMYQFSVPVADEKDYYPSQYISDFIRKFGFDGIRYRSMNSQGLCYTLFNCCEDRVKFCSSEIVLARAPKYAIYSLNENTILQTPEEFDKFYNIPQDTFEELKKKVFQHIEKVKRNGSHEV